MKGVLVPHRECQRLSESALWMTPLWSVRRCTGRFYKSSSDTDCSRRFTVKKKTRERMISTHSRDACFPSGRYSSRQGVVLHLHLTNIQYVCDWLQLFEDKHNNKDVMTCGSTELKLGVSQAASLNQTSYFSAVYDILSTPAVQEVNTIS